MLGRIITLVIPLALVSACRTMNPPSVTFAPAGTDTIKKEFALSDAERAALTRENLRTLTQDQVHQIYKRLKAGRIPDGPFRGDLFFPRD